MVWRSSQERLLKAMIEKEASFGYRTVAWLLGFNKNTVQRIFQIKGWQVRKRAVGMRPRIEAVPSVATAPNERWSTDLARVWTGKDGWVPSVLVIDCHTRELLGWHLSRTGKATTATAALEHALISRFGTLGVVSIGNFFFARTMVWFLPVGTSPQSSKAMGSNRSLSRLIARSRMEWWNV